MGGGAARGKPSGKGRSREHAVLLGACLARHVPFGEALLSGLQPGSFVEALQARQWRICRVLRVQQDGPLVRHVKVCPVNGLPSSAWWVAVEDGQLAPRGTHTHWVGGLASDTVTAQQPAASSSSCQSFAAQLLAEESAEQSSDSLCAVERDKKDPVQLATGVSVVLENLPLHKQHPMELHQQQHQQQHQQLEQHQQQHQQ